MRRPARAAGDNRASSSTVDTRPSHNREPTETDWTAPPPWAQRALHAIKPAWVLQALSYMRGTWAKSSTTRARPLRTFVVRARPRAASGEGCIASSMTWELLRLQPRPFAGTARQSKEAGVPPSKRLADMGANPWLLFATMGGRQLERYAARARTAAGPLSTRSATGWNLY